MTDDLKGYLLKYLTGKFTMKTKPIGTQIPFTQADTIASNIDIELTAMFPNGYSLGSDEVSKTLKANNEINVIWGNYTDTDSIDKGFILLLQKGTILQVITEYDTGVKIGYIYRLALDEDNNFYGIIKGNDFTTPYLTLLNNFTVKKIDDTEYTVKRRSSYNVDITIPQTYDYLTMLTKSTNSSYYLIGNPEFLHMIKIEVGETNKEADFYISNQTIGDITLSNISADDNGATIELKKLLNGVFYIYKATYTDTSTSSIQLIKQTELNIDTNFTSLETGSLEQKGNNTYVINVVNRKSLPEKEYVLSIYRIKNNTEVEYLMGNFQDDYPGEAIICGHMFNTGDAIAIAISQPIGTTINYRNDIGLINEENNDIPFVYTEDGISTSIRPFDYKIVSFENNYNLLNVDLYTNTQTLKYQTIYNPNNYTGNMYTNTNTFIPQYGNLYENNKIIFSRNLYNRTINKNTTTCTIEVPNLYLNNNTITNEELMSETTLPICNNSIQISKNIYETLYVNFINTILMKNITNTGEEINRSDEATVVNQEMTWGLTNTSVVTKYRLIYVNGGEEVKTFNDSEIEYIDSLTARYTISLIITEDLLRIELINDNENMIYAKIDCSRTEKGTFYKITQDLVIS